MRLNDFSRALCVVLIASLIAPLGQAQTQQDQPPFRIRVVEGDGSINNIKQLLNRAASVVVEDQNHNPLSGVSVTFFLPNEGPSGLFPNGSRVLTVFTDAVGVASSRSIRFNNQVGLMKMSVVASLFSQTVTASITQTNISSAASVRSSFVPATGAPKVEAYHSSHTKLFIVLGLVAVAAGAGYYFATKKTQPTATISIGTPVAITPQ